MFYFIYLLLIGLISCDEPRDVCVIIVSSNRHRDVLLRNSLRQIARSSFDTGDVFAVVVHDGAVCLKEEAAAEFPRFLYDAEWQEVVGSAVANNDTWEVLETSGSTSIKDDKNDEHFVMVSDDSTYYFKENLVGNGVGGGGAASAPRYNRTIKRSVDQTQLNLYTSLYIYNETILTRTQSETRRRVRLTAVTTTTTTIKSRGRRLLVRFHCLLESTTSIGEKRNLAISMCPNTTKWVANYDDDDYFSTRRLQRQVAAMERSPNASLSLFEHRYLLNVVLNGPPVLLKINNGVDWGSATQSMMFRKQLYDSDRRLRFPDASYGEDLVFVARWLASSSTNDQSLLILDNQCDFVYVRHPFNTFRWRVQSYMHQLSIVDYVNENATSEPLPSVLRDPTVNATRAFRSFKNFLRSTIPRWIKNYNDLEKVYEHQRRLNLLRRRHVHLEHETHVHLLKDPALNLNRLREFGVLAPRKDASTFDPRGDVVDEDIGVVGALHDLPEYFNVTHDPWPPEYYNHTDDPTFAPTLSPTYPPPSSSPTPAPTSPVCGDNVTSGSEECDGNGPCCSSNCTFLAGVVCRVAAGDCDRVEFCTGAAATCPLDLKVPSGSVCRAAAGECDIEETCVAGDNDCPIDGFKSNGIVCRAAAVGAECDVAETCSGASAACPNDAFASLGTVCRVSSGECDIEERCTGTSKICPTNLFRVGEVCRPKAPAIACDAVELCVDGEPLCPPDLNATAGTACDDGLLCTSPDLCSVSGVCSGAYSCDCMTNDECDDGNVCSVERCQGGRCTYVAAGATVLCRPSIGLCDVDDYCKADRPECDEDRVLAKGIICRNKQGACDYVERCNGASAFCPYDKKLPTTHVCRKAVASLLCDADEYCDGEGDECPEDAVAAAGVVCRPAASQCDVAERCDGTSYLCPSDELAPLGLPCDDLNACTSSDECVRGGRCRGNFHCPCLVNVECYDYDNCTLDICNSANRCENLQSQSVVGESCDDGVACTVASECQLDGSCDGECVVEEGSACVHGSCCNNQCQCDSPQFIGKACDVEVFFQPQPPYKFCNEPLLPPSTVLQASSHPP